MKSEENHCCENNYKQNIPSFATCTHEPAYNDFDFATILRLCTVILMATQYLIQKIVLIEIMCKYRPQRSCGKVMFLHVSVILFTGGVWQADTPGSTHTHPMADRDPSPTHGTATAADGTHPTGMHSCYTRYAKSSVVTKSWQRRTLTFLPIGHNL